MIRLRRLVSQSESDRLQIDGTYRVKSVSMRHVNQVRFTFGSIRMSTAANENPTNNGDETGNIVQRLKSQIKKAKSLGFTVRFELLDGEQPSWCVLGKSKVLFLDLSQTANEQLRSLNETLDSFFAAESVPTNSQPVIDSSQRSAA